MYLEAPSNTFILAPSWLLRKSETALAVQLRTSKCDFTAFWYQAQMFDHFAAITEAEYIDIDCCKLMAAWHIVCSNQGHL
jgi:hypothetical protein